jgi:hypothetical protein
MLTDKDLVFASLMGVDNVGMYNRTQVVQDEMSKRYLPRIPFLPIQDKAVIAQQRRNGEFTINEAEAPLSEDKQFFPLSFSFSGSDQKWLFPYEPMLTISSGNNIVKRNVAKQGKGLIGTVKERWSRKDFDITVTGILMGQLTTGLAEDTYPIKQLESLMEYLSFEKEIFIYSLPLEKLGITKVVVEDYSFPFTKGENVQAYDLKLTSDFAYNLLVQENNPGNF